MKVVSFYRFAPVDDAVALQGRLQVLCDKKNLLGTILVAEEGVNGSLAGDGDDVKAVFSWIEERLSLNEPLEGRWTDADEAPFRRMRVRLKKEIVALGRPDIRPDQVTGKHVGVEEWNQLISDPDTLVIDTRNGHRSFLPRAAPHLGA